MQSHVLVYSLYGPEVDKCAGPDLKFHSHWVFCWCRRWSWTFCCCCCCDTVGTLLLFLLLRGWDTLMTPLGRWYFNQSRSSSRLMHLGHKVLSFPWHHNFSLSICKWRKCCWGIKHPSSSAEKNQKNRQHGKEPLAAAEIDLLGGSGAS